MATLAVNKSRKFGLSETYHVNHPVIAAGKIFMGAAVGDNGAGLARPLVAADPFLGFAWAMADNTGGAASAIDVELRTEGLVTLSVVGVASADDVGTTVYASDDDTFTLTAGSNSTIGKVESWLSGTTCLVFFQSVVKRSL